MSGADTERPNATVREATPDDRIGVRRVLNAAMLEVREDLPARLEAGDVLVVEQCGESETDEDRPILGALVLVPRQDAAHIDAVAVRRARRGQGVGAALVRTAAERHARLTAEFDPSVRPFYESLEFDISQYEDGRLWGVLG